MKRFIQIEGHWIDRTRILGFRAGKWDDELSHWLAIVVLDNNSEIETGLTCKEIWDLLEKEMPMPINFFDPNFWLKQTK